MTCDEPDDALPEALLGKEITRLGVEIDRSDLPRSLERQKKARPGRGDSPLLCEGGRARLDLRKRRQLPTILSLIEKSPFDARKRIAPAAVVGLTRHRVDHIGNLVRELHPLADAVIEIELRQLVRIDAARQGWRGRDVDFPVPVARGPRVVGQERRPALRVRGAGPEQQCEHPAPQSTVSQAAMMTAPAVISAVPRATFQLKRSCRKSAASITTNTTLSLSMGATREAGANCSAR